MNNIVCIEIDINSNGFGGVIICLSIGKVYNLLHESDEWYHIIDDRGNYGGWRKSRFITLEEHRENKLIELGI